MLRTLLQELWQAAVLGVQRFAGIEVVLVLVDTILAVLCSFEWQAVPGDALQALLCHGCAGSTAAAQIVWAKHRKGVHF